MAFFVSDLFDIYITDVTHPNLKYSRMHSMTSVPHRNINTYQFDTKLSVQRCLTDPLLSPDIASDCNCREETQTEMALI